jgi:hypothetical protein
MLNPFATCPERLPPARSPVRPARRIGGHRTPAAPTGLPAIAAVASDRARRSTLPVAPPPVSAQLSTESGAARPAEPTSRPDTRGSSLAGAWYGWLRLWAGSIWPVSLSHSAFNTLMKGVAWGGDSDYLLTRRAADFDKAEPKSPRATTIRHRCTNGKYGGHPLDQLPGDPFAYLEHRDGYSNKRSSGRDVPIHSCRQCQHLCCQHLAPSH